MNNAACKIDCKKVAISAVAAIVGLWAMQFVLHEGILKATYAKAHYAGLWNPQSAMMSRMPVMLIAFVLFGFAFARIYAQGYEAEKTALFQGLKFGFWAGILAFVFPALIEYMVYPVSCKLAGAWAVGGLIESVILGAIVSAVYKPAA